MREGRKLFVIYSTCGSLLCTVLVLYSGRAPLRFFLADIVYVYKPVLHVPFLYLCPRISSTFIRNIAPSISPHKCFLALSPVYPSVQRLLFFSFFQPQFASLRVKEGLDHVVAGFF